MIEDSAPRPLGERNALLAIAVGGGIAGTLDLPQDGILLGCKSEIVATSTFAPATAY
jgi:hypothetical protein